VEGSAISCCAAIELLADLFPYGKHLLIDDSRASAFPGG